MNLYELAFTSYIYDTFTTFNKTLIAFQTKIDNKINLNDSKHRKELLSWLNKWGCRQFSIECHEKASEEIQKWFQEGHIEVIPKNRKLWELTGKELDDITGVYETLTQKTASTKYRNSERLIISVGATGTSKILFILRPEIAVPWDEYIRKGLKYSGDGISYVNYLRQIISEIKTLEQSCKENNIDLYDVPKIINRSSATLPQLVGEYYWITETRKCYPPDRDILQRWVKWSNN